jgi:hypothetical protein
LSLVFLLLLGVLAFLVIVVARQVRLIVQADVDLHSQRAGRLVAAVLLGIVVGLGLHYDYVIKRAGGREAFLRSQGSRFDRFIAKPHSLVPPS